MFNDEERVFYVTIDDKEVEMEVLFTFEPAKDYPGFEGKKYVVYFDPNADEENQVLYCCSYDDDGNLYEITEDEEWNMVDEVVNTFYSEEDEDMLDDEDLNMDLDFDVANDMGNVDNFILDDEF